GWPRKKPRPQNPSEAFDNYGPEARAVARSIFALLGATTTADDSGNEVQAQIAIAALAIALQEATSRIASHRNFGATRSRSGLQSLATPHMSRRSRTRTTEADKVSCLSG